MDSELCVVPRIEDPANGSGRVERRKTTAAAAGRREHDLDFTTSLQRDRLRR